MGKEEWWDVCLLYNRLLNPGYSEGFRGGLQLAAAVVIVLSIWYGCAAWLQINGDVGKE